mmetsp:Transcript_8811/g.17995  ORF Transcript_8811/g.17995 Transcript_8811/m.17995 type:complete len:542 (-) Transcript_8811:1595-3220(-)
MERMEAEREERRRTMKARKIERAAEEKRNIAAGNPGDVDFIGMVREWRADRAGTALPRGDPVQLGAATGDSTGTGREELQQPKICICVRKRPVSDKERKKLDHDSVTCLHPTVWVHSAKRRVDGITKYLDHSSFAFDHAFDENVSTEEIYSHSTMPLIDFVCAGRGGRATVFAYGQTGSGKTFTMGGIQQMVAEDLFLLLGDANSDADALAPGRSCCNLDNTAVYVTFFEIYGGRIQDLLNDRKRLKVLEDGKGEVQITGLEEYEAVDSAQFLSLIDAGNDKRTTHATEANDTSSRSHAICQVLLRDKKTSRLRGKMSLVDLAGSERGTDTKSHNRQRRTESSEINTSLLALKECIRALDGKLAHVPYRASKLTLILKDCFTSSLARTTMIATVSPGASSSDHTLNTLRYADRIKEKKVTTVANTARPIKKAGAVKKTRPSTERSPKTLKAPQKTIAAEPRAAGVELQREPLLLDDECNEEEEEEVYDDDFDLLADDDEEGTGDVVEDDVEKFQGSTKRSVLEEEEELLNSHMSAIQVCYS